MSHSFYISLIILFMAGFGKHRAELPMDTLGSSVPTHEQGGMPFTDARAETLSRFARISTAMSASPIPHAPETHRRLWELLDAGVMPVER